MNECENGVKILVSELYRDREANNINTRNIKYTM